MTRTAWLLLAALLASALALVKTSYESRRLFAALDRARAEAHELDAEFARLDAERRAQGTHLRVEKAARERLKMQPAGPALTAYVDDPGAAAPGHGAAARGAEVRP